MISLQVLAILFTTLTLIWFINRKKGRKGLKELPGPRGWPLIGNVTQFGKLPHLQFNKWTEQYGDIYQTKIGLKTSILISNPKLAKEMLSNDSNYVGRPLIGMDIYEDETLGIINTEGEMWEVHRRFLLRQLRDFGVGKSKMENLILEEVNDLISGFKKSEGKSVENIKTTLSLAVINSLWAVISNQRFQHDDPKLMKLVENTDKILEDIAETGAILIFFPWVKHVIPELSGFNAFRRVMNENCKWFEKMVEEHKQTFQEENIRDFIDAFLGEVKKTTDPTSVFYGTRAERQLVAVMADVFFAGTDTTSSTLAWALIYLCKFPHVQLKLQEEIAGIIPNHSRNVTIADRLNMPYTLALIDEVFRFSSIVPNGVQHRALEGKEFHGYYIPKDAWIMTNMHYMHHDPKVWGDPETFRPERFLSQDGKKYQKHDNLLPFQVGRRQCVGETLARDTVFLFLTNIFQRFEISFDPNSPEPTLDPKPKFVLAPHPYSVIVKDRLE